MTVKLEIMQAEDNDPNCTRASDMSELNVMDFVETEYKSDNIEDITVDNKPRRKSQRKSKFPTRYEFDDFEDGSRVSFYTSSKKCLQRKKRSSKTSTSVQEHVNSDNHLYPYASMMKVLCDEVGKKKFEEPTTEKLFKQLDHANLYYPYSSLLQRLHDIAKRDFDSISSSVGDDFVNPTESEVSQVMKTFKFRSSTLGLDDSHQPENMETNDFERTYSTILLDLVTKHKLQEESHLDSRTAYGIGKILKMCMLGIPGTKSSEGLSFSVLLQRLSLLAERENAHDFESKTGSKISLESSESSLEEEEEEWRPASCIQFSSIPDVQIEHSKRKSVRRKKPVSRFDATPSKYQWKNKHHIQPSCRSKSLLELILDKRNDDTIQKVRNKKAKESLLRSELLERIKDKINSRKVFSHMMTDSCENINDDFGNDSMSEGSLDEQRINHYGETTSRKRESSLLKEYLLKPTDEEISCKSNSDIPIMSENSFLFSRLLQNFEIVSDNHLLGYQEDLEENVGSSILRKMLIEKGKPLPNSTSDDEAHDVENFKPIEHINLNSLQSILCETYEYNSEEEFPVVKQELKCENDGSELKLGSDVKKEGKCSADLANYLDLSVLESCSSSDPADLNPVCKIECEVKCEEEFMEEVCECDICHLPLSSSVDLDNHKLLFHYSKETEPQTAGPTCILSHGGDILQTGLFQEKLPA
ncbi:uncharacterized protein [Palaemon carinicauda]|uniref:uncharacterized protein n=1 Tax=Palaemon carinicauda TaxID=392227 RepID=UPI0035B63630